MNKKLGVLLAFIMFALPSWATWTQRTFNVGTATTGTTHALTVTSTVAHDVFFVGLEVEGGTGVAIVISGVTAGACNTTWTHFAGSNGYSGTSRSVDLYYCTDGVGSITSVTVSTSGGTCGSCIPAMWQATSTLGNVAVDTGATPIGASAANVTSCAATCTGQALSLSANNHFIVGVAAESNAISGIGAGGGCTADVTTSGHGFMHCINSTSGAGNYPASWTVTGTGIILNGAAFQESAGGGGAVCQPRLNTLGVSSCG